MCVRCRERMIDSALGLWNFRENVGLIVGDWDRIHWITLLHWTSRCGFWMERVRSIVETRKEGKLEGGS